MKAHSTRHARTKAHPAEALALADDEADLAGLAVRELEFSAFFPQ
jgi:hypothetical protein